MTEKGKKFLIDILHSIELIKSFTIGINSFEDYVKDDKTKSAVERQLGIIGEAFNKYSKLPEVSIIENASQIISLRNRIIHSYDSLDDAIIWAVLVRHLEPLQSEVIKLISN